MMAARQADTRPAANRVVGSGGPALAGAPTVRGPAPAGTRPRRTARVAIQDAIKRITNGKLRCRFRAHVFVSHEVALLKACKHCGRVERDGPVVGRWIP
jgi:hypothetical protein